MLVIRHPQAVVSHFAANGTTYPTSTIDLRPDIWRAARLIVKRHGADAPIVAAQRADELFNEGDLDGAAVWKCILHAVEELQRVKPKVGERVN